MRLCRSKKRSGWELKYARRWKQWLTSHPNTEHYVLSVASDTEAYGGKLTAARQLTKRSADAAIAADSKENAAIWWENAALREAASDSQSMDLALTDRTGGLQNCMSLISKTKEVPESGS